MDTSWVNIALVVVNFLIAVFTVRVKTSASRDYNRKLSALKAQHKTELANHKAELKKVSDQRLATYKAELKAENDNELQLQLEAIKQQYVRELLNYKAKVQKDSFDNLKKIEVKIEQKLEDGVERAKTMIQLPPREIPLPVVEENKQSEVLRKTRTLLNGVHKQFMLYAKSGGQGSTDDIRTIFRSLIEYSSDNKVLYPNKTSAEIVKVGQDIWSLLEKLKRDQPSDSEKWLESQPMNEILAKINKIEEEFKLCLV